MRFKRHRSYLKLTVPIEDNALLEGSRTSILLVTASRFIFIGRRRRVFFRRAFETYDFDGFLINPFQIFWLKPVQATGADVCANNLFDGLASCFIQFLKSAQGMC